MQLQLIVVPYDSGQRGFRMGRGPEHLLEHGLLDSLAAHGAQSDVHTLETSGDDITSAFDLARQIAAATVAARDRGAFPVILAGNCIASLGGYAGLRSRAALVWLDAHADFNTPTTSPSGFLDGMALAVLTGRCYTERSRTLPGFRAVADEDLVMVGVRAVDPGEEPIVRHVKRARSSRELWAALAQINAPELYLHIDLDALDPTVLIANEFATPRGLTEHTLQDVIATARSNKKIAALAITAYDPSADRANAGQDIVANILRAVIAAPLPPASAVDQHSSRP